MSPRDLAYWLSGFLEMTPAGQGMTAEQVDTLRRHVTLVLTNVTDDTAISSKIYVKADGDGVWSKQYLADREAIINARNAADEETEGHDVGYIPTEEEVESAMNYVAGVPAGTKWVVLAQHHPEAAHNGTLPIQTCPTC